MLQQNDVWSLAFQIPIKAMRMICNFHHRSCYFDAAKSSSNDYEVEESSSARGIRLDCGLFEPSYQIVAEIDRISQRLHRVRVSGKARHHIHIHYRTAGQYQVIVRKRCAFATHADVAN